MAWLGEKFRGDFRRWGCAWATATVLLIRADEERLRRKDFTQRGRRKGGGKSEKDRGVNRGDAEGAEKGNGKFKVKGARLRSKSRRPLQSQRQLRKSRRDAGATTATATATATV